MPTFSFKHLLCASYIAAAVVSAGPAVAQPTGNPKGAGAPPTSDSSKSPSSDRVANPAGSTDTGKLVTKEGTAKSRLHTNRGPGTGTAGGLPKKTPFDGGPQNGVNGEGPATQRPPPQ